MPRGVTSMRNLVCLLAQAGLALSVCASAGATGEVKPALTGLTGDYVEARTASVFAGACHYNGELTTTGRDALLAWNVAAGSWDGVNLAGVRALAVVSADANLADTHAARRSELIVDSAATDAQAASLVKAFKSIYASTLGNVAAVRRAPVVFRHDGKAYWVGTGGAALNVEAMPDNL